MTTNQISFLSDEALLTETAKAVDLERSTTADILRLLMEVDRRRLYLGLGYSSMFAYCTRALKFSEQAAYDRITASRAARRFPEIVDGLAAGDLTLSSVNRMAPHLSDDDGSAIIAEARGLSTREVERLVANLHPAPSVPSSVRALPSVASAPTLEFAVAAPFVEAPALPTVATPPKPEKPTPRAIVAPIAPKRYLMRITISDATHSKLERLQALMRPAIPSGDPAEIVDRALTVLLAEVERSKIASASRPRHLGDREPRGRHIPAAVRRVVWSRDGGRCAFDGTDGRCDETAFLEFHHVMPFAAGGKATPENIQLRCRAHNGHEARLFFGEQHDGGPIASR